MQDCKAKDCPGDCSWSPWLPWTPCDKTCGRGKERRSRLRFGESVNGGEKCSGETEQTRRCSTQKCPVHCSWGRWSSFSTCHGQGKCGMGMKMRTRGRIGPRYGGFDCPGSSEDHRMCSLGMCRPSTATRIMPALIMLSLVLPLAKLQQT